MSNSEEVFLKDVKKALKYLENARMDKAMLISEQLQTSHPNRAEGWYILGLSAIQIGKFDQALELITHAHELDGSCNAYADALAIVYAQIGDLASSAYFGKLSTALPAHPKIKNLLPQWLGTFSDSFLNIEETPQFANGLLALQKGMFNQAIEFLHQAINLNQEKLEYWPYFTLALFEAKRYHDALIAVEIVQKSQPDNAEYLALAGCVLAHMTQDDAALNCFDLALQIDSSAEMVHKYRIKGFHILEKPLEKIAEAEYEASKNFIIGEKKNTRKIMSDNIFRIGIISSHFDRHSVTELLLPNFFIGRDASVKTIGYNVGRVSDKNIQFYANFMDDWKDVEWVDNDTLNTIMQNDQLDILIDIDGYDLKSRPSLFKLRPAPIIARLFGTRDTPTISHNNAQAIDVIIEAYDGNQDQNTNQEDQNQNQFEIGKTPIFKPSSGLFSIPFGWVVGHPKRRTKKHQEKGFTLGYWGSYRSLIHEILPIIEMLRHEVKHLKVLIQFYEIGHSKAVEALSGLLAEYDMQDMMVIMNTNPYNATEFESFISAADAIVECGDTARADIAAYSLGQGTPYFVIENGRHTNATAGFLNEIKLPDLVCADRNTFLERLFVLIEDNKIYNAYSKKCHRIYCAEKEFDHLKEKSAKFLKSLHKFCVDQQ